LASDILHAENLSASAHQRTQRDLFFAFIDAAKKHGKDKEVIIDGDGRKFRYADLMQAAFALSVPIKKNTRGDENVGILLPTGAGAVIAFLSIHAAGRVPAMLNFTAGMKNLKAAADTAPFDTIIFERRDWSWRENARGFRTNFPKPFVPRNVPDDTGVILFTSGTEGNPKGVVLTHSNILANVEQIEQHVELEDDDIIFNPLPTFHCYGLTAGTLWPIYSGRKVVLHPSPLQTKTIAKRIFKTRATVIFATDTFLQQYMRASKDGGLNSLRIAVCGAERVREETRKTAEQRFDMEVLEGYGVTECAPVLAANQPGDIQAGTIGKMLPGIEARLEPVEGLDEGGQLWVRGPNIMKGYISPDNPGQLVPLEGGWHDTGDVVSVNDDRHYVIRGRIKRFAKIGGEMVSLMVVENCASAVWPEKMHAAAIVPDPKRGEQIVLVTEEPNAKRRELLTWAQTHGVPEISVPKKIITVESLPVLGTGKLDYVSITALAKDAIGA